MNPLLTFYGDDFTGTVSTAHLLSNLGVSTVVFTTPPSRRYLEDRFPDAAAVGVAGEARTWSPDEMDRLLAPILETMKEYRSPVFLYKICSTFDSAPQIGSIGRAIEVARSVFSTDLVPVMPAAPAMGRMTVFGNHFAAAEDDRIYRLDRHRSMANHPTTPMTESDLLCLLAGQTDLPSGLVDVRLLEGGPAELEGSLKSLEGDRVSIVLFDGLFDRHIDLVCEVIWNRGEPENPVFMVGSHEVGAGFGRMFRNTGMIPDADVDRSESLESAEGPLLAVSGSCSTLTKLQIYDAVESGFRELEADVTAILDPSTRQREESRIIAECLELIDGGESVVVHTCMGPEDPMNGELLERSRNESRPVRKLNAELGYVLGRIAAGVLRGSGVRRVAVAGGDTSGRVLAHLGVRALKVVRTPDIDDPICCISSDDAVMDGVEVALKGGQVGGVEYFSDIRTARTAGCDIVWQQREEATDDTT